MVGIFKGDPHDIALLEQKCDCGLTPEHICAEHDWCCQICGGSHTERICPDRGKTKK